MNRFRLIGLGNQNYPTPINAWVMEPRNLQTKRMQDTRIKRHCMFAIKLIRFLSMTIGWIWKSLNESFFYGRLNGHYLCRTDWMCAVNSLNLFFRGRRQGRQPLNYSYYYYHYYCYYYYIYTYHWFIVIIMCNWSCPIPFLPSRVDQRPWPGHRSFNMSRVSASTWM